MTVSAFESDEHPLGAMKLGRTPRARDPNLGAPAGATPQPTPAPLTTDNNRITMRIPAQATKLNLGQGDARETATRNKRPGVGTESGIVGQTDAHIHWETFGTTDLAAKTLVRLGIPPTSVPPNGYAAGASTGIGCMFPQAYANWNGYSMVTQGAAYQEARDNHLVASATGEVRIVGSKMISLGSAGGVIIGADGTTTPTKLIQNQGGPDDAGGGGEPDTYFRIQKVASTVATSLETIMGGAALISSIVYMMKNQPVVGATGWLPLSFTSLAGYLVSGADLVVDFTKLAADTLLPSSTSGKVGVYAEKSVVVGALETVSLNAGVSGSIVAGLSASISALSASVTGLVSSSMTGILVNIGALWSASLQSTFGNATVRSPKGVQVYSSLGKVTVTGTSDVQLNSVAGSAYVHGPMSAFIGSGEALGWGLRATPTGLAVGQMATPALFTSPGPVPAFGITISDALLNIQLASSYVKVSEVGVSTLGTSAVSTIAPVVSTLGEAEISMTSPVINVTGDVVNLG